MRRSEKQCAQCGGTGQVVQMNSCFIYDKLRKERCGICAGTGKSSYPGCPDHNRWQAKQRATFPVHFEYATRQQARSPKPEDR